MRLRATLGALSLRLDGNETADEVKAVLEQAPKMSLEVELASEVSAQIIKVVTDTAEGRGMEVRFRPLRGEQRACRTEIVARTVRSGQRVSSVGTVVVLGDVNPGAEVVAGGDVIVVGKLRGLAHAGAGGNERAMIWALSLASKQLRIADKLAVAPENAKSGEEPERASIKGGQIIIEPWKK